MNTPRLHGVPSVDVEHGEAARLARAGFIDELGQRALSFDPANEMLVETLRLRREFAESVPFESALRARVARVGRLASPALASIQSVERTESGLLLVSRYSSGRRLSELSATNAGPGLAFDVVRQVTPALAVLQKAAPNSGHGALSLDRLVMTRDKRLVIVEHALAPALESLHWSRPRFNDLGLVVADAVPVRLDERADLRQLGWIVLSLLVGRTLPPGDYPAQAVSLLDEAGRTHGVLRTTNLGEWLGRMLQVAPNGFATAEEAAVAFEAIGHNPALEAAEADGALLAFPSEASADSSRVAPASKDAVPTAALAPAIRPPDRTPKLQAVSAPVRTASMTPGAVPAKARRGWFPRNAAIWAAGALLAIALAEAFAIVALLMQPRLVVPAPSVAPSPPSALAPLTLVDGSPVDNATASATDVEPSPVPAGPVPRPSAAPAPQPGRVAVAADIDLEVLRDNAVIGTTAGPFSLPGGQHTLVFANRGLGYRTTQVVNVTNGQLTPVRIAIPSMLVSVNAVPWADVTIDGVAQGQTPLANVSLPIGSHEFIFRHPDLGERRQTVVVRADVPTRVTQNFR